MSLIESELIINKAFSYDFYRDLDVYAIEFGILHDEYEMASQLLTSSISSQSNRTNGDESSGVGGGAESFGSAELAQLETDNQRLRRDVKELTETIQLLKLQIHNQDDQFYKMYHENKQLKCKVDALEIERNGLLKKIKEQSRLLNPTERI